MVGRVTPCAPPPESISMNWFNSLWKIVVYRNAILKGAKSLFKAHQYDTLPEFLEIEQAESQRIFVSKFSVLKFCEHGVTPSPETVSGKKS
jgi:hypothetical protein